MNLLVYDEPATVRHLIRATAASRGHRVSLSAGVDEARLKLDTGLFDAVVLGAGGAPRALAEHLEAEHPATPLILAGVAHAIECIEPIAAVLPRPLRLSAFHAALRSLEARIARERGALHELPVDLVLGERRLACRVIRRASGRLLLERAGGEPMEGLPAGAGARLIRSTDPAAPPVEAEGRILFAEGARFVAVDVGDAAL